MCPGMPFKKGSIEEFVVFWFLLLFIEMLFSPWKLRWVWVVYLLARKVRFTTICMKSTVRNSPS